MFKKCVNVFRYKNEQNNGNQTVLLYFVLYNILNQEWIKNTFLSRCTPFLRSSDQQRGVGRAWPSSPFSSCSLSTSRHSCWPSQGTRSPWWSLGNRSSLPSTPMYRRRILASSESSLRVAECHVYHGYIRAKKWKNGALIMGVKADFGVFSM